MKRRPESTISERELLLALAASGRDVAPARLTNWRKDGLLPPLASHGLGQGRGRHCYWHERDIVPQACAAFDYLSCYGRTDSALRMLWLSGFKVALPQLRRAWLHHIKAQNDGTLRTRRQAHHPMNETAKVLVADDDPTSALLLAATLAFCGEETMRAAEENKAVIRLIEAALTRLGYAGPSASGAGAAHRLWTLISVLTTSCQATHHLTEADDAQMLEAHAYMCIGAGFLQSCAGDVPGGGAPSPAWLAEHVAAPMFLVILALMRSANQAMLDRIAAEIGAHAPARGRRVHDAPAPAVAAHA